MKKILPIIFALIFTIGLVKEAGATHAQGGNIRYEYLGDSTYAVYYYFFWNCGDPVNPSPASPPSSVSVNISSSCMNLGSFNLPQISEQEVTDLECGLSTCNGGTEPGTIMYEYKTTVFIPVECADWTFSYSLCCRNGGITNLDAPGSASIYSDAYLNNVGGVNNSSPIFFENGVPGLCELDYWEFSFGAIDFDGDSLVYELVPPLNAMNDPILYLAPFSETYPFETVQGFLNFDPLTGEMSGQPVAAFQMGVISVLVHEFRNGVEIGTVRRDIQVITSDECVDVAAAVKYNSINVIKGSPPVDDSTFTLCVNTEFELNLSWVDTNILAFPTLIGNSTLALLPFNNASITFDNSVQDSLYCNLEIVPSATDTGLHVLQIIVEIETDSCLKEKRTFNYYINVVPDLELGDSLIYCNTGDSIMMTNNDAGNLTWYHINGGYPTGLDNDTINHPLAGPATTTDYVAISDIEGNCKNIDTIRVHVYPIFDLPDTTYSCLDDSLIIAPLWLNDSNAVITYLWSDGSVDSTYVKEEGTQNEDSSGIVGVILTDGQCTVEDSTWVEFIECFLEIPNVFTPNGDDVNDAFEIKHFDKGKWDMTVYNKWGKVVFQESPYENEWDGGNLPDGTYFYHMAHQELRLEYKGWLRISR